MSVFTVLKFTFKDVYRQRDRNASNKHVY